MTRMPSFIPVVMASASRFPGSQKRFEGLPVVASRVGGIPEMVIERETALLFEPGRAEELRRHLEELAGNAGLREDMGSRGHDLLLRSGMTWDTTAEDFDEIFTRVLKQ